MSLTPEIVSYNVKGLRNREKRRKIFYLLHHWKVDIALLQETHSCVQDEPFWSAEWGGKILFSHGDTNARGTCLLLAKNFKGKILKSIVDLQGRVVTVVLEIQEMIITVAGLYVPNQDMPAFFEEAFAMVESLNNDLHIIGGDFNTVLDLDKDLMGGKGCSNARTRKFINEWMQLNNFADIWRLKNENNFQASFVVGNLRERNDSFLISSALIQTVDSVDIKYIFGKLSDHTPFP